MNRNKHFKCFIGLLIISNLIVFNCANSALAKPKTDNKKANTNYGLPTHRRDGGSRSDGGNCVASTQNQNLVALIPNHSIGINASASPKLFFYVPETNKPKTLEFVLRNERDELMYEAFLTTGGKGIMSVEIPADLQSDQLETEQNYHWYLSIICNPQQRSRDIVVEGWLRQEEVDLATKQELNTANSIAQAQIYHESGFWYDALTTLATEHSDTQEPVVEAKWTELLYSVGLEELASAPFIEAEIMETSASSRQN